MKIFKLSEYEQCGEIRVICEDLVGTSRNWREPAKVLGLSTSEFILELKTVYNANLRAYRKDGKVTFVGYGWKSLIDARRFKNAVNRKAREKNYLI